MQVQTVSPSPTSIVMDYRKQLNSIEARLMNAPLHSGRSEDKSELPASQVGHHHESSLPITLPVSQTKSSRMEAAVGASEDMECGITHEEQVVDELLQARETFMCQRWGDLLGQLKAGKSLGVTVRQEEERSYHFENKFQQEEHRLRGLFETAEGDIHGLVRATVEKHHEQARIRKEILERKKSVECLLNTLENIQGSLSLGEEALSKLDEDEKAEEQDGQNQIHFMEAAIEDIRAKNCDARKRVSELQSTLEVLQTAALADGEEASSRADPALVEQEAEVLAEAGRLRGHAEDLQKLLETLQGLYNVAVTVVDGSDAKPGEMVLRVGYPSQHALEVTLSTSDETVQLLHARLELPIVQQRRRSLATSEMQRLMMNQVDNLVTVAQGLTPPHDLLFLAREVGWMVASRGVAKQEIRELMKRYIVKHNEAMDELTVTYAEGVVASFLLLEGYPQMPGSVRIVGLVGVGGWKDTDLAITSRSLNGLGLESLTALVDALHERIAESDSKA